MLVSIFDFLAGATAEVAPLLDMFRILFAHLQCFKRYVTDGVKGVNRVCTGWKQGLWLVTGGRNVCTGF